MKSYDDQYGVEQNLFGVPYVEFEAFVKEHAKPGGTALDLGCGQGRDALMLARHGYAVTGVDSSHVGIDQMVAYAKQADLVVDGVVANFYEYELADSFDAIVLDSILHFEKADKKKELALLDVLAQHINDDGFFFLFVHKSQKKEKVLMNWVETIRGEFEVAKEGYVDYLYEESATGFQSAFQYFMLVLKRTAR